MSTPTTPVFGLASYANAVTGLIFTSLDFGETYQTATVLSESGNRVQSDDYDIVETVSFEAVVNGDISALVRNSTITLDSNTYTVRTVQRKKTNTGHYNVSGTAERWIVRTSTDTVTAS